MEPDFAMLTMFGDGSMDKPWLENYGHFTGGDPRFFRPDPENSDAEIAGWYRAVHEIESGQTPPDDVDIFPMGCATMGGRNVFGMGNEVRRVSDEEWEAWNE